MCNEDQVHEPDDDEPLAHAGSQWDCTKCQESSGSLYEPCAIKNKTFVNLVQVKIMSRNRHIKISRFAWSTKGATKLMVLQD